VAPHVCGAGDARLRGAKIMHERDRVAARKPYAFRHYLEPLIVAAQLAYYTDAAQESSIRHKENQA
jgi:hypothetical protein